jgi:RNA polymerase sigma factor (sigma-70 family)
MLEQQDRAHPAASRQPTPYRSEIQPALIRHVPREDAMGKLENRRLVRLVARAARRAGRRFRLSATEAKDLESELWVKILTEDTISRCRGRSLQAYLTTVAANLLLDLRNRAWGKWRPTAAARRLGRAAIALERLAIRDGLCPQQAEASLRSRGLVVPPAFSKRVGAATRPVPRLHVSEALLEAVPVREPDAMETLIQREREQRLRQVRRVLAKRLSELPVFERRLVGLRFVTGLSVADIARQEQLDQKPLYRRLYRILSDLRTSLVSAGVDADVLRQTGGARSRGSRGLRIRRSLSV